MEKDLIQYARDIIKKKNLSQELEQHPDLMVLLENLNGFQEELIQQKDELDSMQVELKAANKRLEDLYQSVPLGLLELNEDFKILEANIGACKLFDLGITDLKGKKLTSLIHPDDQDLFYLESKKVWDEIAQKSCRLRLKNQQSWFYGNLQCVGRSYDSKKLLSISIEDITDLINAEKQKEKDLQEILRRQKEKDELLSAAGKILKTNDFAIVSRQIFDACASIIGAKAGYVALLSDDGEENELLFLEDGGMLCTVNPDLPMPIRGLRAEAYYSGKPVYDNDFMKSEWVKFMPKGHMDLRNVLFSPLNIEGKTVGIMGFACKDGDFTDEDAEIAAAFGEYAAIALQNSWFVEKLEKHGHMLEEMNETKDKLISMISHDLRSPFSSILGFLDLLSQKISEGSMDDADRYLKALNRTARRAYDLVVDLVEWSRLQIGKLQPHKSWFALYPVVEEVLEVFDGKYTLKRQQIISNISRDCEAYGDQDMIAAILRNLISNAIKFTPDEGTIKIEFTCLEHGGEFRISDSGMGMPEKQLKDLFTNRHSGETTPGTNQEKGSGLGLMICKDLVDLHNGTIRVESTEGKGTTFTVFLPKEAK